MNLHTHRTWITPLVIGMFALSAATGLLMFFHLDTGLNKVAHEWLGWLMVAAVVLHVTLHVKSFKRHWAAPVGKSVIVISVLALGLSFLPVGGGKNEPPFIRPLKTLAQAPLPVVALVAGIGIDELKARLQTAGKAANSNEQTIASLAGDDLKAQVALLNQVLR